MTTAWIVLGPSEHGVTLLAENLTAKLSATDIAVHARTIDALWSRIDDLQGRPDVHVHFTDQLFGPDCAAAAAAYEKLAARLSPNGTALSVTLHDLPVDPDDPARYRRRAAAYAAVAAATTGVVIVSSAHEAALLGAFTSGVRPLVIPLPIEESPWPGYHQSPHAIAGKAPADVAILGFVYPGKGHAAAIEALDALPDGVGLTALGRVAVGHRDLAAALGARAGRLGRRFGVADWIAEDELPARLRAAGIPLVGHERLSASGSIGSWLSAGRRPLVPDVAYVRELVERLPGTVTPYPHNLDGLRSALRHAFRDPGSTWLDPAVVLGPSTAEVSAAYREAVTTAVSR